MKTTIKNLVLLAAAGFPVAAIAGTFGAPFPAQASLEAGIGMFTLAFGVLMLMADYSRPTLSADKEPAKESGAQAAVSTRSCEPHRLAA
jgi:hypothetical protein